MADTHSIAEKMRLLEPTVKIRMNTDSYHQRQKCRPMTLVSGNERYLQIFSGVPATACRRSASYRPWRNKRPIVIVSEGKV